MTAKADLEFIRLARRLRREVMGPYQGYEYVPMGENHSLMVPVTRGCDYGACLFCDLNQYPFYEYTAEEIKEALQKLAVIHQYDRRPPERAVLLQGNPFCLSTEKLLLVSEWIRQAFPAIKEIACFARVQDVLNKSDSDLITLREAGYACVTLGLESGSDQVLTLQHKGVNSSEQALAMQRLGRAQLDYDVYIMLGIGGRDLSEAHVRETARLLNAAKPRNVIIVTTVLFKGAKLRYLLKDKRFKRLTPLESMEELLALLRELNLSCMVNASHKTNYFPLKGRFPENKEKLIAELETLIEEEREVCHWQREGRRWGRFSTEK